MDFTPVTSSSVSAVGYDPESREMRVRFSTGKEYSYPNVPPEKHAAMMRAASIGSFMHKQVKPHHPAKRV